MLLSCLLLTGESGGLSIPEMLWGQPEGRGARIGLRIPTEPRNCLQSFFVTFGAVYVVVVDQTPHQTPDSDNAGLHQVRVHFPFDSRS